MNTPTLPTLDIAGKRLAQRRKRLGELGARIEASAELSEADQAFLVDFFERTANGEDPDEILGLTRSRIGACVVAEMTQKRINIDKDFPIPDGGGSHRGKFWAYYDALDRMEVGDSFVVNDKALIDEVLKGRTPGRKYSSPGSFAPIKNRHTSKNKPGPKYVARWIDYRS